jgi:hypothetical protein
LATSYDILYAELTKAFLYGRKNTTGQQTIDAKSTAKIQADAIWSVTGSGLNGYATQSWVISQGYITISALNGYATQSWVASNYTPLSRNLTINGITYDLSADRSWTIAAGSGTVTSVSVVSANGFAGTVATASTTPAITISTSVTGLLKGNGTAISAAVSGTDYAVPTSGNSILYGNGAGGFSNVSVGSGLSFVAGTLSASSGGITSLNGLTGASQTFGNDTNVTIVSTGTTHTITWAGTLADSRIASASTWNAKQSALSGTGIVVSTGGTISYLTDNSTNWNTAYTNRITSLTTTGSSGAATLLSNVLNIPNYTIDGLLPSQTSNSGKYLTTNGTSSSWATISAMTNPMTTQGDTIYGGASGTPTRLALGTTNYFYQAGATAPTWFDLFGTANTFSARNTFSATNGILLSNASTSAITHIQSYIRGAASSDYSQWLASDSSGNYKSAIRHLTGSGSGTGVGVIGFGVSTATTGTTITPYMAIDAVRASICTFVKMRVGDTSGVNGVATTAANSTLEVVGSLAVAYVAKTANYTATISDYTIDCLTNTFQITLPTAVGITGRCYCIKNSTSGTTITIATTSSQTIDGSTTKTLNVQYQFMTIQSDGSNWKIISQ